MQQVLVHQIFAKNADLPSLRSEVEKLDINKLAVLDVDKLKAVSVDLKNLNDAYDDLVKKVNAVDTSKLV